MQAASFASALAHLETRGAEIVELDFSPFYEIGSLLYNGAWVAERLSVIDALMRDNPGSIHPVTSQVIGSATQLSAVDAFRGIYRLAELKRKTAPLLAEVDLLCVPSIPGFPSIADIEADPTGANSRLGKYTDFVNLMDLCGISVPTGPRSDGRPGSITLIASAGGDVMAAALATPLHQALATRLGATTNPVPVAATTRNGPLPGEIALAVVGAHMSGLPLNHELTSRAGRYLQTAATAPVYRLFALAGSTPARPGMLRCETGAAIELEIWALPAEGLSRIMAATPAPLSFGTVMLADGSNVNGFLVENAGIAGARDITEYGGWRAFLESHE